MGGAIHSTVRGIIPTWVMAMVAIAVSTVRFTVPIAPLAIMVPDGTPGADHHMLTRPMVIMAVLTAIPTAILTVAAVPIMVQGGLE